MISVVIPVYNEHLAVEETITEIQRTLTDSGLTPFEVVVVDDGSSDGTAEAATNAGARIIRHPENAGYGRALKTGIRAATYDTIAITDADGTYPVDRIPELHSRYVDGFDMVVGARTGPHYRESVVKSPMRWILRKIVEFVSGRSIPDINSGLRIFSRSASLPYFRRLCDGFSFTTSITLSYMMTGGFVSYVDIPYHARKGKTKVRLLRDAFRTGQYVVEAAIYYDPFRIMFLFSLLCVLVGVIFGILALSLQILSFFTLAVGSFLIAMLMVGLGLMAVLLKQILDSSVAGAQFDLRNRSNSAVGEQKCD